MKKKVITMALTAVMALSMSSTAFAASWQKNDTGWWWQEDNGSYPTNTWQWIDGNNDGVAECYYFDESGYCLLNTTTPDGYGVNGDGAWVVDGVIQTKAVGVQSTTENQVQDNADIYGNYINPYDEVISLSNENGALVLRYYEDKGDEIDLLSSEMIKINDTTYQSTTYEAVNIKFINSTTFEFYDGMIYTKQ